MPGCPNPGGYWSKSADTILTELKSQAGGLTSDSAATRLAEHGLNVVQEHQRATALRMLAGQFASPLILILIFAAVVSITAGQWVDAAVVIAVVFGSGLLGFFQEYSASSAVARLRARVTLKTMVLRDGRPSAIPSAEVVPGDVVLLSAGSLTPADGIVLEAKDFFVNEAVLTGETFPAEKKPGTTPREAGMGQRTNCVFMGSTVRSGTARALIVVTGCGTAYGQIAARLELRPPQTEFEHGIRSFGVMLTELMAVLVLVVFCANAFNAKPAVDSMLFAVALAVGLAPELLPVIVTVTLSRGAQAMAHGGVIVRRLSAIENLGSMDVLCTDKTGTLTEGEVCLENALNVEGNPSGEVLRYAVLNAHFQTGLANPLDEAIGARHGEVDLGRFRKLDEIPYDFIRKRLSVVVAADSEKAQIITKGALEQVLDICDRAALAAGEEALDAETRAEILRRYEDWSAQGFRVLGVAAKQAPVQDVYNRGDEAGLTFLGYLLFMDPPKTGVRQTLAGLASRGVEVKIVTGDARGVAVHVANSVGLRTDSVLTGAQLRRMGDEALWHAAEKTSLFVQVDPNQKERIIRALQVTGHVVGYLGDGINDAPALHAADVGISVDQAVDVAKEAAGLVLLEHDLDILQLGIVQGRKTFANTLKYIFTTTSANFGNMLSMASASLFLPFLPLLAKQILLNNFLSDIPGMAIASDRVDKEWIDAPHRWDVSLIRRFTVVFGLVSAVFDFLTFGILLLWVKATPEVFRTAWFVESLLTELVIALVVRTRQPFFRSAPGRGLWISTLAVGALTLSIPYLPYRDLFGFVSLDAGIMLLILGIAGAYVLVTEMAKKWFYRNAAR